MDPKARRHQKEKEQAAEAKKNPPAKMSNKLVLVFILGSRWGSSLSFHHHFIALKAARVF
jgi:hypothetical protein